MNSDPSKLPKSRPFAEGLGPAAVYAFFRAAAWLACNVPIAVADRAAQLGGDLAWRTAGRKRKIVERNLARVVGNGPELDRVVRAAFRSYADYWVETFRLGRYSRGDLLRMVHPLGNTVEVMEKALGEGRGVILATGHIGFYDIGVAWVGAKGWPFTTVGEVLRPRALFDWFAGIRSERGMHVIPASGGPATRSELGRRLDGGSGVALLADRDLKRRGVWGEFFREKTTFPASPAMLVVDKGVPLLAGAIYKDGPQRYNVLFERVPYSLSGKREQDILTVTGVIATALEGLIRRYPEQWHLFNTNWPSDEPHLPPRGPRPR